MQRGLRTLHTRHHRARSWGELLRVLWDGPGDLERELGEAVQKARAPVLVGFVVARQYEVLGRRCVREATPAAVKFGFIEFSGHRCNGSFAANLAGRDAGGRVAKDEALRVV